MYTPEIVGVTKSEEEWNTYAYNYEQNFLPGEIKITLEVESLPANRPIGVTGVTVTDVVIQKGNPEALNSSLVTEVAVSAVM